MTMAQTPSHIQDRFRFPDDEFRPLPLLSNGHVQTLLGTLFTGRALSDPAHEHQITLPDGDALVFHDNAPSEWRAGAPPAPLGLPPRRPPPLPPRPPPPPPPFPPRPPPPPPPLS